MTKIRRNDGVVIDWRAEVFDPPAIDHSVEFIEDEVLWAVSDLQTHRPGELRHKMGVSLAVVLLVFLCSFAFFIGLTFL